MDIKSTKLRFGIIGNDLKLSRAINVALQVASTNISVLINGESGTGKETIPQIIHQNSKRKHNNYIAVNCGAIPEGTIDSELFGHEKGSFTGANESRKGYFEAADNGTIFLDEIAELPLPSQARLLRVLENGEFIKVGSSKPQKTNVMILILKAMRFILSIMIIIQVIFPLIDQMKLIIIVIAAVLIFLLLRFPKLYSQLIHPHYTLNSSL